jgi:hypothetical protein
LQSPFVVHRSFRPQQLLNPSLEEEEEEEEELLQTTKLSVGVPSGK